MRPGKLISVEKRVEFAADARENLSRFFGAMPANHEIVVADIEGVCLACEVDRIFVDLPEPWRAVGNLSGMLRMGGLLVSLSPNVGQVQLTHRQLNASGFGDIVHFELLRRDWKVDQLRARPSTEWWPTPGSSRLQRGCPQRGESRKGQRMARARRNPSPREI